MFDNNLSCFDSTLHDVIVKRLMFQCLRLKLPVKKYVISTYRKEVTHNRHSAP